MNRQKQKTTQQQDQERKKEQEKKLIDGNEILEIRAISIKTGEITKVEMTAAEWYAFKKNKNYKYIPYQLGFSQI